MQKKASGRKENRLEEKDSEMEENDLEDTLPSASPAEESSYAMPSQSCPHWTPLSDQHMQLMQACVPDTSHPSRDGTAPSHAVHTLRVPTLLTVENPALLPLAQHAQRICEGFGISKPAGSGRDSLSRVTSFPADSEIRSDKSQAWDGATTSSVESTIALRISNSSAPPRPPSSTEISLARLQHACSVACGHHRIASALPEPDGFLMLMHALFGSTAILKLPRLLEAVSAAPAGRFVWPVYSSAMHGPQPLLTLCFTARVMLATEHPDVFTALERANSTNEILFKWLQGSLLPVLTVRCACHTVVLALVGSPLLLAAAVVAVLGMLRERVVEMVASGGSGDCALREWLHAVHCFDADEPELIASSLEIEGRHRNTLLPLLLVPREG